MSRLNLHEIEDILERHQREEEDSADSIDNPELVDEALEEAPSYR